MNSDNIEILKWFNRNFNILITCVNHLIITKYKLRNRKAHTKKKKIRNWLKKKSEIGCCCCCQVLLNSLIHIFRLKLNHKVYFPPQQCLFEYSKVSFSQVVSAPLFSLWYYHTLLMGQICFCYSNCKFMHHIIHEHNLFLSSKLECFGII